MHTYAGGRQLTIRMWSLGEARSCSRRLGARKGLKGRNATNLLPATYTGALDSAAAPAGGGGGGGRAEAAFSSSEP